MIKTCHLYSSFRLREKKWSVVGWTHLLVICRKPKYSVFITKRHIVCSFFFASISMFSISKQFPLAVKFIRRFPRRLGWTCSLTDKKVRGFSRKVDCFRVCVKISCWTWHCEAFTLEIFQCSYRRPRKPIIESLSNYDDDHNDDFKKQSV